MLPFDCRGRSTWTTSSSRDGHRVLQTRQLHFLSLLNGEKKKRHESQTWYHIIWIRTKTSGSMWTSRRATGINEQHSRRADKKAWTSLGLISNAGPRACASGSLFEPSSHFIVFTFSKWSDKVQLLSLIRVAVLYWPHQNKGPSKATTRRWQTPTHRS